MASSSSPKRGTPAYNKLRRKYPHWTRSTPDSKRFHRVKDLFYQYAERAKRLGVPFTLCFWEFKRLIGQPCFYCERPPSNRWRELTYSGIDRAVNSGGYVKGNSVPCCRECNSIKSDFLTAPETRAVALALKNFRAGRA